MKKWTYQFESANKTFELHGGDEAMFSAKFLRIFHHKNVSEKFIINVSDYRISKKPACSIKSFGPVQLKINGETKSKFFEQLTEGDVIETSIGEKYKIKILSSARKRKYSTSFKSDNLHPNFDETFPDGWSEPGHNLIYYRPRDASRFHSNKGTALFIRNFPEVRFWRNFIFSTKL